MPRRLSPRCPTCGKTVRWEGNAERPFCSRRCRLVDLGNWASERYRIVDESLAPAEDGWEESDGDEGEKLH